MIPHWRYLEVDLEVHPDDIHSSCISSVCNQSQTSSDAEWEQRDIHPFHSTARVGKIARKKEKAHFKHMLKTRTFLFWQFWTVIWMGDGCLHFLLLTISVSVFWSHSSQYIQSSSSSFECLKKVFRPFTYRVIMKKKYTMRF